MLIWTQGRNINYILELKHLILYDRLKKTLIQAPPTMPWSLNPRNGLVVCRVKQKESSSPETEYRMPKKSVSKWGRQENNMRKKTSWTGHCRSQESREFQTMNRNYQIFHPSAWWIEKRALYLLSSEQKLGSSERSINNKSFSFPSELKAPSKIIRLSGQT